jgi:hypothetical protein
VSDKNFSDMTDDEIRAMAGVRTSPARIDRYRADDEIICPACGECGLFTLHDGGACPSARCQNCQHRIGAIVLERDWTSPDGGSDVGRAAP